jgi:hypothetical protein
MSLRSSGLRLLRFNFVMRGLDLRIHPTSKESFEEDGWSGLGAPKGLRARRRSNPAKT